MCRNAPFPVSSFQLKGTSPPLKQVSDPSGTRVSSSPASCSETGLASPEVTTKPASGDSGPRGANGHQRRGHSENRRAGDRTCQTPSSDSTNRIGSGKDHSARYLFHSPKYLLHCSEAAFPLDGSRGSHVTQLLRFCLSFVSPQLLPQWHIHLPLHPVALCLPLPHHHLLLRYLHP